MNFKNVYLGIAALSFSLLSSSSFALEIICGAAHTAHLSQPRASILGNTPEEIHRNFPGVIEQNLRTADTTALLSRLSNREVGDLATVYARANGGSTAPLLRIIAQRADAPTLQRLTGAFGQSEVATAVARFAPTPVREAFARGAIPSVPAGDGPVSDSTQTPLPDAPNVDMTPFEIYLEFRTAPIGSLGVMGSLFEAGTFAATRLTGAFGAGYTLGSGIAILTQTYAPGVWETIGGTIDQSVQNILDATDDLLKGNFERSFDDVMGGLISDSGDYYGDFDVSESYGDYMDAGGC